jgi:hypothetical protein
MNNVSDSKRPKFPWYFKKGSLIIAFMCIGPFMLPLVWFNPGMSRNRKITVTVIIAVLSYFMWSMLVSSLSTINEYYKMMDIK